MADRGLRPGFQFPVRIGAFGIQCRNFQAAVTAEGFVIPGSGNTPLLRSFFPPIKAGPARFEILRFLASPDDSAGQSLFVADHVDVLLVTHPAHREPFLALRSKLGKAFADAVRQFTSKDVQLRFTPIAEAKVKKPDPLNEGWTLGWGVYRGNPWHFVGLFDTEQEAREAAAKIGKDYKFDYGSNEHGTDNFISL
jgi:hypothetical protein